MLPASLPITFGRMVGRPRAGWLLLAVMVVLFVAGLVVCDLAEQAVPPQLAGLGVAGGNMEGKEVRFGVGGSVLAAVVTSNGATGSYNSMHDSFQPLGVLVPLVNMLLGEVVFGGPGDRALQHGDGRAGGGLHGRADGRPHAGVPRQDDHGRRGQADRLVHPADAAGGARC